MQVVNKLAMFQIAVTNMPKAKEFYVDSLGLELIKDYRQDDDNWWVSLKAPDGGTTITLTTHRGHMAPGSITLYFVAPDVAAAHEDLHDKGVEVSDVSDDLYGPGSGVKWFNFSDPDGNLVHVAAA
jgi:catechol 2,3-dioxygenase-like lactoylglutathione lyase family enzyme